MWLNGAWFGPPLCMSISSISKMLLRGVRFTDLPPAYTSENLCLNFRGGWWKGAGRRNAPYSRIFPYRLRCIQCLSFFGPIMIVLKLSHRFQTSLVTEAERTLFWPGISCMHLCDFFNDTVHRAVPPQCFCRLGFFADFYFVFHSSTCGWVLFFLSCISAALQTSPESNTFIIIIVIIIIIIDIIIRRRCVRKIACIVCCVVLLVLQLL